MGARAELSDRLLLDGLAEGVIATDPGGTIVYANAAICGLLGTPEGELVGRSLASMVGAPASAQRARRYLRLCAQMVTHVTSLLDLDRVLALVADTLVRDVDAALARIWLHDPQTGRLHLRASAGLAPAQAPDPSAVLHVIRTQKPCIEHNLSAYPDWVRRHGVVAGAIFPLLPGGELQGLLAYYSRQPLGDEVIDVLQGLSSLVTASLHDVQSMQRVHAARAEAEAAHRRSAFLAKASAVLASSFDTEATLGELARLAVPQFADWCTIDLVDEASTIRRVAVAHVDADKIGLVHELRRRYPVDPNLPHGFPYVIRTGKIDYWPEVPDSLLVGAARDAEHLRLLRIFGYQSYLCVPMSAHERTLGAITFVCSDSGRRFGPHDLALAEDLGRRAGLAVEHALLLGPRAGAAGPPPQQY